MHRSHAVYPKPRPRPAAGGGPSREHYGSCEVSREANAVAAFPDYTFVHSFGGAPDLIHIQALTQPLELQFRDDADRVVGAMDCPPTASVDYRGPGRHVYAREIAAGMTGNIVATAFWFPTQPSRADA